MPCDYRPSVMLRGVTENLTSWSGTNFFESFAVPPRRNSVLVGPRNDSRADCTRKVTSTRRMRNKSASYRSTEVLLGHQGPSISIACVSSTWPELASVGSRGTCAPLTTWNAQFSPDRYGAFAAVPMHGGLGPYVVYAPFGTASHGDLPGSSIGGCGSP